MALEPFDRPLHAFFESDLRFPVYQLFRPGNIEASAWLAVGLCRVPFDFVGDGVLVGKPCELGDHVNEILDRDLHVRSEVDRGWVVDLLGGC